MPGFERFERNSAGLREYLMSGVLYPVLMPVASRISANARSLASQHVATGAYESGITGPRREVTGGRQGRVRVRVYATDEKSDVLEARYKIMAKAIG